MKKIILLTLFTITVGITSVSAISSIGVVGNTTDGNTGGKLTLGFDSIEFEFGLSGDFIALSADWSLGTDTFSIAGTPNWFWSVGAGVGGSINLDPVSLGAGIILPLEFGYRFPIIASGLDLYLQFTPKLNIIHHSGDINLAMGWGGALGLRLQF